MFYMLYIHVFILELKDTGSKNVVSPAYIIIFTLCVSFEIHSLALILFQANGIILTQCFMFLWEK